MVQFLYCDMENNLYLCPQNSKWIMNTSNYTQYTDAQLNKIGNAAIYLSEKIERLSKTKFLKLIYILDEISVSSTGIPFFNLKYKVWKFGPVAEPIFIDLSSEMSLLTPYISNKDGYISPKKEFNDDEFSDNDIDLLEKVINMFGKKSAKELVDYTHKENSLWRKTAKKNKVLELLENEVINSTDFFINLGDLVAKDVRKKAIYEDYIEQF